MKHPGEKCALSVSISSIVTEPKASSKLKSCLSIGHQGDAKGRCNSTLFPVFAFVLLFLLTFCVSVVVLHLCVIILSLFIVLLILFVVVLLFFPCHSEILLSFCASAVVFLPFCGNFVCLCGQKSVCACFAGQGSGEADSLGPGGLCLVQLSIHDYKPVYIKTLRERLNTAPKMFFGQ